MLPPPPGVGDAVMRDCCRPEPTTNRSVTKLDPLLLEGLLNSIPAEIYVKDKQGRVVYGNSKYTGPTDEEKSCEPTDKIDKKKGEFPILDSDGNLIGIGGFQSSDTSNKEVKKVAVEVEVPVGMDEDPVDPAEFSQDESFYTDSPVCAALGIMKYNEAGVPIDIVFGDLNTATETYAEKPREEMLGRSIAEVWPGIENDASDWITNFSRVAQEGKTWVINNHWSEAMNRWVGGIAFRPRNTKGRFVCLWHDQSDTLDQEAVPEESAKRYQQTFDTMVPGVIHQDVHGHVIEANRSAHKMFGPVLMNYDGEYEEGMGVKIFHENGTELPPDQFAYAVAARTATPVIGAIMGILRDGQEKVRWYSVDAIPRFKEGETVPYQVCSMLTDVTRSKEVEFKLLDQKEKAETADRLKSSFLANMSHEIRTPLNGIIGHLELALSNNLSDDLKAENLEGLQIARRSGELLLSIIEDILDLSKIEAGQLDIEADEVFDPHGLVEHVASLGESMIVQRKKSITLATDISPAIANSIFGDCFRLQQILINLVSNAVKFTDKGGVTITAKLSDDKEFVQFNVKDTGKGIPTAHLRSIFEPFRQVEIGDTRKHGGTGLGLTISRKLVEMMGGTLTVFSNAEGNDTGSCFCFTFPHRPNAARKHVEDVDTSPSTTPRPRLEEFKIVEGGKILVAEDERVSRLLVKRMLETSGYDVILAENGQEAVDLYTKHQDIALILMDVQMPHMDGLEATTIIRKLESETPNRPALPIIALSAGAMKGDNEKGLAVGMSDYLTKPVKLKLLQETLTTYLGKRKAPQPQAKLCCSGGCK
eukprot:Nitzschia sp. Nitz4//scaffold78_size91513//13958//16408//NITZ4_004917-RA/size91513-processed-gene-0.82-mRNA-1//-1//CDS//3329558094//6932//frame0